MNIIYCIFILRGTGGSDRVWFCDIEGGSLSNRKVIFEKCVIGCGGVR